jgi:hypothetical protein
LEDETLAVAAEVRLGVLAAEGQLSNRPKMTLAGFGSGTARRRMGAASEDRRRDRNRDGGDNG